MDKNMMKSLRSPVSVFSRVLMVCMISIGILGMPSTIALADVPRCGSITVNESWISTNNNYIITCDVIVNTGVTLTIQPGVVVKFDTGTSLQVNGILVATGATFTSNNTTPAKGDWGRIYFTTSSQDAVFDAGGNYLSGSKIQNSLIEWGGQGTNISAALETNIASPYLDDNTIQNNLTSGIHAVGRSTSVPIVISRNSFSYNDGYFVDGVGIYVSSGRVISNTISNNGGEYPGKGGGIFATASTIAGNTITANDSSSEGGGVYASGSTIIKNTISSNYAYSNGGGIYVSSSTISNNTISGNTAGYCSGVHAIGNSTVTGNTVENNTAMSSQGGGICAVGGAVSGNTLHGNSSPNQGGGIYAYQATVTNNLVNTNNGGFGGGIFGYDANLAGNTLMDNNASSDGGGIYAYESTNVSGNTVQDNTASRGGGIFAEGNEFVNLTLSGNTIQNNAASSGAGIYAIEAAINGNTIVSNTASGDGGGIYAEGGTVTGNKISTNTVPGYGHGSGAFITGETDLSYNDVLTNTAPSGTAGGISINGLSGFQYNNLYGNLPYNAEVISSQPVTGTLNYWGQTICTDIPAMIYDGNDAPGRGKLTYTPSLYAPVPLAQLPNPTDLGFTIITTGTVELYWTEIPDIPLVGCRPPNTPDSGYRVYYDSDSACTPFDGDDLIEGASPIDAGGVNRISLSGLGSGNNYFVITAYDYLGRESSFSNVVQIGSHGGENWIFMPMISN